MQYLLMIYGDENEMDNATPEEMGALISAYGEFTESIVATKNYIGGEALQNSDTATCVSMKTGKMVTTDGPFIETKEQLGGYYLINADNLDEAVEIASRIPNAKTGTVEVRPIMSYQ